MTITRNIQIPDTKNTITVEIELSCSELETAYREQERYYRLMDAEGQLCTYLASTSATSTLITRTTPRSWRASRKSSVTLSRYLWSMRSLRTMC